MLFNKWKQRINNTGYIQIQMSNDFKKKIQKKSTKNYVKIVENTKTKTGYCCCC